MKNVIILGSTGSVGKKAVKIIKNNSTLYKTKTLVAGSNIEELTNQIFLLNPENVCIYDEDKYIQFKKKLSSYDKKINIFCGQKSILELCRLDYDIGIMAISGMQAIQTLMNLIERTKVIGLANKESIVCAGEFIKDKAKKFNSLIIPVDSEHSALFQLFQKNENENNCINYISQDIKKICITASGGPFFKYKDYELLNITTKQAIKHPNWKMGAKISVDSATMMNKGLEVIEASQLFDIELNKIDVLIEPKSIIHAMIEYIDGTSIMHASNPDMELAISYAMSYPNRNYSSIKPIKWEELNEGIQLYPTKSLNQFMYNVLQLAYEAGKSGIISRTLLNILNEIAVNNFLNQKIKFIDIYPFIIKGIETFNYLKINNVEDIINIQKELNAYYYK